MGQPTGTLSDGREALLRMGLALTNLSICRLREGSLRALIISYRLLGARGPGRGVAIGGVG